MICIQMIEGGSAAERQCDRLTRAGRGREEHTVGRRHLSIVGLKEGRVFVVTASEKVFPRRECDSGTDRSDTHVSRDNH